MQEFASEVVFHYPIDCRPAQVVPLGSGGGFSGARLWHWTTGHGPLVLRRWSAEHPTPSQLRFIHDVLRHAAGKGVAFLPVPLLTIDGQSFVQCAGYLWELAPWMPGQADFHLTQSAKKLAAAMVALAQFHQAAAGFESHLAPAPSVAERLARAGELAAGGAQRLERAIDDAADPQLAPLGRKAMALAWRTLPTAGRLLQTVAATPYRLQPSIRDVWHDHVLFAGDRVTGLVDFSTMRIDTPMADVARLLGSLAGNDRAAWQWGMNAYASVCRLSDDERRAIAVLDTSGQVLAACNWAKWVFVERRQFEDRLAVRNRMESIVKRLLALTEQGPIVPV